MDLERISKYCYDAGVSCVGEIKGRRTNVRGEFLFG